MLTIDQVQGYETLRRQVLAGAELPASGSSLCVLVDQGMFAWMSTFSGAGRTEAHGSWDTAIEEIGTLGRIRCALRCAIVP